MSLSPLKTTASEIALHGPWSMVRWLRFGLDPTFQSGLHQIVRAHRKTISSLTPFALSHENETVADGKFLGFTFGKQDFLEFRREIRKGTGMYTAENLKDGKYPTVKLPLEKRYSARYFNLAKVFKRVMLEEIKEVPWYHTIDNWEGYCNFLGSQDRLKIQRPPNYILNYREWNLMGADDEK